MASTKNSYYGHKAVLARYVGIDRRPPILGYLQHGWSEWMPFIADSEVRRTRIPKLVWGERDQRNLAARGYHPVTAIGAPFLYLLHLAPDQPRPEPRTLIAFPQHTVSGETDLDARAWSNYADELAALERYKDITVCLHPSDYADPSRRSVFERSGMRTMFNGDSTAEDFITVQRECMAKHEAATTNQIGTSLIYAGALGRRVFLHGSPMPTRSTRHQELSSPEVVDYMTDLHQREFSELAGDGIKGKKARDWAFDQLGVDMMRSPSDLAKILGWRAGRRPLALGMALAASARRKALRL